MPPTALVCLNLSSGNFTECLLAFHFGTTLIIKGHGELLAFQRIQSLLRSVGSGRWSNCERLPSHPYWLSLSGHVAPRASGSVDKASPENND